MQRNNQRCLFHSSLREIIGQNFRNLGTAFNSATHVHASIGWSSNFGAAPAILTPHRGGVAAPANCIGSGEVRSKCATDITNLAGRNWWWRRSNRSRGSIASIGALSSNTKATNTADAITPEHLNVAVVSPV